MSVKVCPTCGSEYLASVSVCADDGTELVESDVEEMEALIDDEIAHADDLDRADLDPDADEDDDQDDDGDGDGEVRNPGDQVAYELGDWDNQSRVLLGQLLTGESLIHVWEAGTLVIRADDEERVDELVEQVEITNQPTLDPEKEQVVYELEDWPEEKANALADSLGDAGIPFGFDESGDLVVHEEDEDRIEPLIDQVDLNFSMDGDEIANEGDEDDDDGEEADGLATQDALSDLFIAADRLLHDAKDKDGVLGLVNGANAVNRFALPYGFAPGVWADIKTRSATLRDVLEGPADADAADDDAIKESARELREVLRQYV